MKNDYKKEYEQYLETCRCKNCPSFTGSFCEAQGHPVEAESFCGFTMTPQQWEKQQRSV